MNRELHFPKTEREMRENIRRNLLYLMKSRRLTPQECAGKCEVPLASLERWIEENGTEYPEMIDLIRIRDGFWVSIQWLVEYHETFIQGEENLSSDSFRFKRIII